jgi:hypothetical protein
MAVTECDLIPDCNTLLAGRCALGMIISMGGEPEIPQGRR